MATVHHIGPDNRPATLTEVREAVAQLLRDYADNADTLGALGLVAGLLDTVQCHCEPPAAAPAPVIPLLHDRPVATDVSEGDFGPTSPARPPRESTR